MYNKILDNSTDLFIFADQRANIIDCSSKCEDITGYEKKELIGKNIKIIIPDHIAIVHDDFVKSFIEEKRNFDACFGRSMRIKTKDGTLRDVVLTISNSIIDGECYFVAMIREEERVYADKNKTVAVLNELSKASNNRLLELSTQNGK